MKTFLLSLLFSVVGFAASATALSSDSLPPLNTREDCKKAEPLIKKCVAYLLTHPADGKDDAGKLAAQLMILWMTNTEYQFGVDGDMVKYCDGDKNLPVALMASMVAVVLADPSVNDDPKKMKIAAYGRFADYCASDDSKVKLTAALKKLIDAQHKGKIASVLDMSVAK